MADVRNDVPVGNTEFPPTKSLRDGALNAVRDVDLNLCSFFSMGSMRDLEGSLEVPTGCCPIVGV